MIEQSNLPDLPPPDDEPGEARSPKAPSAPPAAPVTAARTRRNHFLIGFLGWYLLSGLYFLLVGASIGINSGEVNALADEAMIIFTGCTTPVTVILLVLLGIKRSTRWIAAGLLAALAVNFLVSIVLGAVSNAACMIPFFIKP